jgi:hypothetical protein
MRPATGFKEPSCGFNLIRLNFADLHATPNVSS